MFQMLAEAAFKFPTIDNHAHPLLKEEFRTQFPFESAFSEASGKALTEDAPHTLACFRATAQLAPLLGLDSNATATWEQVKTKRSEIPYLDLCKRCLDPCKIQCLLLDDGLGGVAEFCEGIDWHSQNFTETKRIVRVEVEAENVLKSLLASEAPLHENLLKDLLKEFTQRLTDILVDHANDPLVVGFKSVVCYRTGLDMALDNGEPNDGHLRGLKQLADALSRNGSLRLQNKPLNDLVVHTVLKVAGDFGLPVQFHTGLGDSDITLSRSSPAHMQPMIKAYPNSKIVLLHSSYPYMRDAGYLTSVYENVFLDFGEIFPAVSGHGQRAVIRQILEITPTNKLLWSTDGHWFPETFYLGTLQARKALYDVLSEIVDAGELSEEQAVLVVKNALFYNSNKLYRLGLEPADASI